VRCNPQPGQEWLTSMTYNTSAATRKPSARIIQFPPRGRFANAVRIEREHSTDGWLALRDAFGWAHGDFASALRDAHEIARGYGIAVVSSAGRFVP